MGAGVLIRRRQEHDLKGDTRLAVIFRGIRCGCQEPQSEYNPLLHDVSDPIGNLPRSLFSARTSTT
eukprot:10903846-Lingulodinium_polyedra.AAC.1